jgi:hypothetical protein
LGGVAELAVIVSVLKLLYHVSGGAISLVRPRPGRISRSEERPMSTLQAYYEELAELSEHEPLTLHEVCQYVGWTPLTREEAGRLARLCTQYGIRTTEDWLVWAEKL